MKEQPKRRRRNGKTIIALYEGKIDRRTSLTDALTDLMHYADKHFIDFSLAIQRATDHFNCER